MGREQLWFGFLNAGEKSSPVLMDTRLDTANPQTVYLYNLKRDAILEYRRDLIEEKLLELKEEDASTIKQLKSGHKKAKKDFQPRGAGLSKLLKATGGKSAVKAKDDYMLENDEEDFDEDADVDFDDSDAADWSDED